MQDRLPRRPPRRPPPHGTGSASPSPTTRAARRTLCAGCGHDAITERIVEAFYEMGVQPGAGGQVLRHRLLARRRPAYFLSRARTASTRVHGRMPSVATGAMLANRTLLAIGVSGDGDTASIGIGQFVHLMRRNLPMVYVIENNGVYGLTKGQFCATADVGSKAEERRR